MKEKQHSRTVDRRGRILVGGLPIAYESEVAGLNETYRNTRHPRIRPNPASPAVERRARVGRQKSSCS